MRDVRVGQWQRDIDEKELHYYVVLALSDVVTGSGVTLETCFPQVESSGRQGFEFLTQSGTSRTSGEVLGL